LEAVRDSQGCKVAQRNHERGWFWPRTDTECWLGELLKDMPEASTRPDGIAHGEAIFRQLLKSGSSQSICWQAIAQSRRMAQAMAAEATENGRELRRGNPQTRSGHSNAIPPGRKRRTRNDDDPSLTTAQID
jgi:hypothetical protein